MDVVWLIMTPATLGCKAVLPELWYDLNLVKSESEDVWHSTVGIWVGICNSKLLLLTINVNTSAKPNIYEARK